MLTRFGLAERTPAGRLPLPEAAVREALVNALTHRDFRVPSAVQIIRYQDRIEVRNPGYSLVDDDQLGQPGSFPRNPRIADFFREMRLAENKGTGIAAIRRGMQRVGLTPPVFDSDRARNLFVVTLWLHNLLGEEDTSWLRDLSHLHLSDEQAKALVVARRSGSVSNAMLRNISGLDTLGASNQLRQLRDLGLLELRGRGSATHYVLGATARAEQKGELAEGQTGELPLFGRQSGNLPEQKGELDGQRGELPDGQTGGFARREVQTGGLPTQQTGGLAKQNGGVPSDPVRLLEGIPPTLRGAVRSLAGRPSTAALRSVIVELCRERWWTPKELAALLARRKVSHLTEKHLSVLVRDGSLERRYPDNPAHPQQAYRTRKPPDAD